jgi:hypothetical protein
VRLRSGDYSSLLFLSSAKWGSAHSESLNGQYAFARGANAADHK